MANDFVTFVINNVLTYNVISKKGFTYNLCSSLLNIAY